MFCESVLKNWGCPLQAIQLGAAKVLSMLLMVADALQQYLNGSIFGLDDKQVWFVSKLLSIFRKKGREKKKKNLPHAFTSNFD